MAAAFRQAGGHTLASSSQLITALHHRLPTHARTFLTNHDNSSYFADPSLQDIVYGSIYPQHLKGLHWPTVVKPTQPQKLKCNPISSSPSLEQQLDICYRMIDAHRTATRLDSAKANTKTTLAGPVPYANRTQMMKRLIKIGRVISAMTAFTKDLKLPPSERQPFTAVDLEQLIVALRRLVKTSPQKRPAKVPRFAEENEALWKPSQLDPDIDARSLPLDHQCLFAMATIFDVCVEQGLTPTNTAVSSLIATFSKYLPPPNLLQAVELALTTIADPTSLKYTCHLRNISLEVITSLLIAFGKAQRPDRSVVLLNQWALAQFQVQKPPTSSLPTSTEHFQQFSSDHQDRVPHVYLSGWSQNIQVWNTLIRCYSDTHDLPAAAVWLERYRSLATCSNSVGIAKPKLDVSPYLTLMAGYSHQPKALNKDNAETTTRRVRQILDCLRLDQVAIDPKLLHFLIELEVETGHSRQAMSILQRYPEIVGKSEGVLRADPFLLRALLKLHIALGPRAEPQSFAPACSSNGNGNASESVALPPLRKVLSLWFSAANQQTDVRPWSGSTFRSQKLLHQALEAALVSLDYPAALLVLDSFRAWQIETSEQTHFLVLHYLATQKNLSFDAFQSHCTVESQFLGSNGIEPIMDVLQSDGGRWSDPVKASLLRNILTANVEGQALSRNFAIVARSKPSSTQPRQLRDVRVLQSLLRHAIHRHTVDAAQHQASSDNSSRSTYLHVQPWVHELVTVTTPDNIGQVAFEALSQAKRSMIQRLDHVTSKPTHPSTSTGPLSSSSTSSRSFTRQTPSRPKLGSFQSTSTRTYSTSCAASGQLDLQHLDPIRVEYVPHYLPYSLGLTLQEHLVAQRAQARAFLRTLTSMSPETAAGRVVIQDEKSVAEAKKIAHQDTLLLLQHMPVYTEGRREGLEDETVGNALRALGADYHLTKRGGQITYHGPGQLVGYPIVDIGAMQLATKCYVDRIQSSIISAVENEYQLSTVPPPDDHTGVWADEYHKLASIGIQVRHRITSHGFALNVEQKSMKGFRYIVACGIKGKFMTCVENELTKQLQQQEQQQRIDIDSIVPIVSNHFGKIFGRRMRLAKPDDEFKYHSVEVATHCGNRHTSCPLLQEIGPDEKVISRIWVDGNLVQV